MCTATSREKQTGSRRSSTRHRMPGFTLPELMVGIAIVSILAALVGPSISTMIASQRTRAGATELYLALAKARSESIKRNTNVILAAKGGDWATGWEIADPDDAATRLEDHGALKGMRVSGTVASVEYQPTGRIRAGTRPQFDFSYEGSDAVACVSVDLSGMPTQKSSSC